MWRSRSSPGPSRLFRRRLLVFVLGLPFICYSYRVEEGPDFVPGLPRVAPFPSRLFRRKRLLLLAGRALKPHRPTPGHAIAAARAFKSSLLAKAGETGLSSASKRCFLFVCAGPSSSCPTRTAGPTCRATTSPRCTSARARTTSARARTTRPRRPSMGRASIAVGFVRKTHVAFLVRFRTRNATWVSSTAPTVEAPQSVLL